MQKNSNSGEDVDLYRLIVLIKNKIYKWRILLIIAPLMGIATGAGVYLFSSKEYLSRMTISSNVLTGPGFIVTMENLHQLVNEGNSELLAKLLNVDSTVAEKIKGIKVYSAQRYTERKLNTDLPEVDRKLIISEFTIEAYVSDNNILPQLEKGILFYLGNNIFIKDRAPSLKKELTDEVNIMKKEISSLDSVLKALKNIQTDPSRTTNSIVTTEGLGIFHKIIMETEDRLEFVDLKVVDSFVPFKKPYYPKPFFTIISWLFIYIIAAIFIIVFFELNQKLKEKNIQNH